MGKNTNLHKAKEAKNDEFYTQLSDIEKEISHYDNAYFRNKVVICNCNDGITSKFWEYFHKNFKFKGLKRLIGISYALQPEDRGKVYIYEGGTTADSDMDLNSCTEVELRGSGDFREEECIAYLKEADVVVTNPPFSLFREYVAQLMKLNKKFLIIGNKNCITYKEVFPLIRNDELWIGNTPMSTDMLFSVLKEAEQTLISKSKSGSAYRIIDGVVYARSASIWFTNLNHKKRHEKLILWKNYTPEEYPKYDNYDAINVDKVSDIPVDYDGVMGVPITFLDKYNPDQFEIVALGNSRDNFTPNKDYINPKKHTKDGKEVNGGAINCVLALEQETRPVGVVYYTSDNSKYLVPPYARLLIRRKDGI